MMQKIGIMDLDIPLRHPVNRGLYIFAAFFALEILLGALLWRPIKDFGTENKEQPETQTSTSLLITQGNSLLPINNILVFTLDTKQTVQMVITAYSSTPWETDASPYVTAAGTIVRSGIVANNLLPIGTKLRMPELYGNKVFVVEDRMNSKKGKYQLDIWFPSYWEAKTFGTKRTYVEILES